jgi:hypothetical protein
MDAKSVSTNILHNMFSIKIRSFLVIKLSKMTMTQHFGSICSGWQKQQHSLTPTLDCIDILIGLGDLLLVGSDFLLSHAFMFIGEALNQ